MGRYFVIACLVIIVIAVFAAATTQLSSEAPVSNQHEINGVTPSPTAPPTPPPTPTAMPTPPAR